MVTKIDINTWARKEHYLMFLDYDQPFFNITAEVDVSNLWAYSKINNSSLFLLYFYGILKTVNEVEEFRLRIRGDEVVLHDCIQGGCTVMRDDNTFGFGYFPYCDNFKDFELKGRMAFAAAKSDTPLDPKHDADDMFFGSVVPWIAFTSVEHPKRLKKGDSIPKIVMSKIIKKDNKYVMTVAVSGHHALMDGYHMGEFFRILQEYCTNFK